MGIIHHESIPVPCWGGVEMWPGCGGPAQVPRVAQDDRYDAACSIAAESASGRCIGVLARSVAGVAHVVERDGLRQEGVRVDLAEPVWAVQLRVDPRATVHDVLRD